MECERCHKKLSNYYSLWRHRKICNGRKNGSGLAFPSSSGSIQKIELPERRETKDEVTSEDSDEELEKAALENLIAYEKKELLNLLKEFAAVIDEEDESKLIELGSFLDDFFIRDKDYETRRDRETLPKVHRQLDGLIRSKIPRTELIRAKMPRE